jgi:hypothetical protein
LGTVDPRPDLGGNPTKSLSRELHAQQRQADQQ